MNDEPNSENNRAIEPLDATSARIFALFAEVKRLENEIKANSTGIVMRCIQQGRRLRDLIKPWDRSLGALV